MPPYIDSLALNKTTGLQRLLDNQKQAHLRDGTPSAKTRADRLSRAIELLLTNNVSLQKSMCEDFGHRCRPLSELVDVAIPVNALRHARKHLKSWMKPSRRGLEFPLGLVGARGRVEYQPKGAIGIIAPWNFPVNLCFSPLAGVLAAGNRAMIKPSEFTPATSELIVQLVGKYFDADEVHVVTGGADVGAEFSALPFDHLVFTGSTVVGRQVMRAAADNLVPVTLELGGKSPVIVGESANIAKAATRIMHGKVLNCGQICIAPDYVLLPEAAKHEFVSQAAAALANMFPIGLLHNHDYTSVLGQRHYDRLQAHIDDARLKGAEIISLNPNKEDFSNQSFHKMPPTLIVGAKDNMTVMQEEVFGPVLPIRLVENTSAAIDYVNSNSRPLALYFFGTSSEEEQQVLQNTVAGGVTVNDIIMHISQETLPFGGIGPSGMGRYHGHDGFLEFSHHKSVFKQMPVDALSFLRPPYGRIFKAYSKYLLKR
jgi:coniferyl-aldehyde dehydrogenase